MHICPNCNHILRFNLEYVYGQPKIYWTCSRCQYDSRNITIRYAQNTGEIGEVANGTSSDMRNMWGTI
jgi:hypothetical protein